MNQDWQFGIRGPLPITNSPSKPIQRQNGAQPGEFQKVFEKQLNSADIVLSNHAKQRLEKRNIQLNTSDLQRIGQAINQVSAKGGKESLIMYKDTAFVVNVPNRTIITAVDKQSMTDNVFTNIDSALII